MSKQALILVDIQNDFCPSGRLAVTDGDKIIPFVNSILPKYEIIVATQDFHPANHKSFASNNAGAKLYDLGSLGGIPQVMWPDHCVQGTSGVEFHPSLNTSQIAKVFPKGTNPEVDSYSGFFDNDKKSSTGMGEWLRENNVSEVVVVGLALDYCVKATALDAVNLGFKTSVLLEGTKAVNISPDDGEKAISELQKAGVVIVSQKMAA